jgi:hypothetical protein
LFDEEAGFKVSNTDDVGEVRSYVRAFRWTQEQLRHPNGLSISVRLLCEAQPCPTRYEPERGVYFHPAVSLKAVVLTALQVRSSVNGDRHGRIALAHNCAAF